MVYLQGREENFEVEVALQWNEGYAESVFSFANNINTIEGGTHLIGFKSALTRTINQYAAANGLLKKDSEALQGEDVREGLTAVVSVKVQEPQFEGQTKTKLGNSEVKGFVEALVNEKLGEYLEEHPDRRQEDRAQGARRRARARGDTQGERAGAAQRRARLRLAAGQAGRLPGTRSGAVGAVPRRGRFRRRLRQAGARPQEPGDPAAARQDPQRREGALRQMISSQEIRLLITALGTGIGKEDRDLSKLRYHTIIIMTDADVDGSHIRTLLLTLFYRQFQELIEQGHVFIAQPPLYKVKKGKTERYLKDEPALEDYLIELGTEDITLEGQDGRLALDRYPAEERREEDAALRAHPRRGRAAPQEPARGGRAGSGRAHEARAVLSDTPTLTQLVADVDRAAEGECARVGAVDAGVG